MTLIKSCNNESFDFGFGFGPITRNREQEFVLLSTANKAEREGGN